MRIAAVITGLASLGAARSVGKGGAPMRSRLALLLTTAAFASAIAVSGQTSAAPEYEEALLLARTAALAEYTADGLLVASRYFPSQRRADMLAEAFDYAERAGAGFPQQTLAVVDSKASWDSLATRTLNRLSLQVRATRAMLDVDQARALDLFARISNTPPPLTCSNRFTFALTEYYLLAGEIGKRKRSLSEDSAAAFLQQLVTTVSSSAQLEGAVRLIQTAGGSGVAQGALLSNLAQVLTGGTAVDPGGLVRLPLILDATTAVADRNPSMKQTVLAALRDYVVQQAGAERCQRSFAAWPSAQDVSRLNKILCGSTPSSECSYSLTRRDLQARRVRLAAETDDDLFFVSPEERTLGAGLRRLLFDPESRQRLEPGVRTEEWLASSEAALDTIQHWNASSDTRVSIAMQKAIVLQRLVPLISIQQQRTRALDMYLDALKEIDPSGTKPPLWFAFARGLIDIAPKVDGEDATTIALAIQQDPVLRLYAALSKLAPARPAPAILKVLTPTAYRADAETSRTRSSTSFCDRRRATSACR